MVTQVLDSLLGAKSRGGAHVVLQLAEPSSTRGERLRGAADSCFTVVARTMQILFNF